MKTITMPIEEYEELIKAKDKLKKLPTVVLHIKNSAYFSTPSKVVYLNEENIADDLHDMLTKLAEMSNALGKACIDHEKANRALEKVKDMSIYEFIRYRRNK